MQYQSTKRNQTYIRLTPIERIQRHLDKTSSPEGCHLWTATTNNKGYGMTHTGSFAEHDIKQKLVHRLVFEDAYGPIPDGMTVEHKCHTRNESCVGGTTCLHRRCCNIDHLELLEMEVNKALGRSPAAINARKTHCKRDHEFTAGNTWLESNGARHCRMCSHARAVARWASVLAGR